MVRLICLGSVTAAVIFFLSLGLSVQADAKSQSLPPTDIDSAIVGGKPVADNSYPYVVRLEASGIDYDHMDDIKPFCSGSLIASRYVLTAAHCVSDYAIFPAWYDDDYLIKHDLRVRFANIPYKPTIAVKRVAFWADFNSNNVAMAEQSDLALLELDEPSTVEPVLLASLNQETVKAPLRELGYGPQLPEESDGLALISLKVI